MDDNVMNIRVIEGLLKEYQIQVTYAASGQAWIVLYAVRLASHGYNAEEIGRRVEKMLKRVESQFIMPSVNLFCQGGGNESICGKIL